MNCRHCDSKNVCVLENSTWECYDCGKTFEPKASLDERIIGELRTTIQSLVRQYKANRSIDFIVKTALNGVGIEPTTVLRRAYDGCSQADWLCEKMIGETLIDGHPKP